MYYLDRFDDRFTVFTNFELPVYETQRDTLGISFTENYMALGLSEVSVLGDDAFRYKRTDLVIRAEEDDDYAGDTSTTGVLMLDGDSITVRNDFSRDKDWLAIDLTAGDFVNLKVEGLYPQMTIVDEDGNIIYYSYRSDDETTKSMDFFAEETGRYYIEVFSGVTTADTEIIVSATTSDTDHASNRTTRSVVDIDGAQVAGQLTADFDVDFIAVNIDAPTTLEFTLTANTNDPYIHIFLDNGTPAIQILALTDENGEQPDFGSVGTYQVFLGTVGRYLFQIGTGSPVDTIASNPIDYTLSVTEVDNTDVEIAGGTDTTAVINLDGQRQSSVIETATDSDWFRIDATAGQEVTLLLESNESLSVILRDANGNELLSSSTGLFLAQVDVTATYYIDIQMNGNFTNPIGYTISAGVGATAPLGFGDRVGNNKDASTPFDISGDAIHGRIDYGEDQDWYEISVNAGDNVVFDIFALDELFIKLVLFDSAGTFITRSFNDGQNQQINWNFDASGTYYIVVDGFIDPGNYTLSAEVINANDDYAGDAATAGVIEIDGDGVSVVGDFENDQDWLAVDLTAGQVVSFLAEAVMVLYDSDGVSVVPAAANSGPVPSPISGRLDYIVDISGRYYIGVSVPLGETISVRAVTPDDDYASDINTVGMLNLDGVDVTSRNDYMGDSDWFSFTAEAGQFVSFSADASFTAFSFYDSQGNQIGRTVSSANSFLAETTGQYFVGVEYVDNFNPPDNFVFRGAVIEDDYTADQTTTGRVEIGGNATQAQINYGGDVDWFRIDAEAGQSLTFNMSSASPSLRVALLQSNGQEIGRAGVSEYIVDFGASGVYYLSVFLSQAATFSTAINYSLSATLNETTPTLDGDNGNNTLQGTDSDDVINGQGGDDVMNGGAGDDALTGGAGADQFVFGRNGGTDTVRDFTLGEDLIVLDYGPYLQWSDITENMTDFGTYVVIDMGGGTRIQIDGVGADDLSLDNFVFGYNDPDGTGPFLPGRYFPTLPDKYSSGQKDVPVIDVVSRELPADWDYDGNPLSKSDAVHDVYFDIDGFIL
ncbi:calcium-binding protein [Fretibacter rubidus]|uniref:calcium-binding protein n=1 Tax=Fretibacter rubidus TaxID=570162 RepID=UPI00352B32C8